MLIEVAETHPPATDKKLAKVKTGEQFGIWSDKLGLIQVGQRPRLSHHRYRVCDCFGGDVPA
jgi:hypothetical protein